MVRGTLSPRGRGQGEGEAPSPDSALPPHPVGYADSTPDRVRGRLSPPRGEATRALQLDVVVLPVGEGRPGNHRTSQLNNSCSTRAVADTARIVGTPTAERIAVLVCGV